MEEKQNVWGGCARIGGHEAAPESRRYLMAWCWGGGPPIWRYSRDCYLPRFCRARTCSSCLRVPPCSSAILGNPIASLDPTIHFAHLCEAFLGILPHFHLHQHFFVLHPIPYASKPAVVGGCELVLRPEKRDEYLSYHPSSKGVEWKSFCFYVGNFESPLPERTPGAPKA